MSQLAYNIHGERFEPPKDMLFWRVRRLKPGGRGTPEVVFGADGLPLLVSSEAEVDEFRRLVRNAPGRYRLDPVTEEQAACEDGAPAYIQIEDVASNEVTAPTPVAPHDDLLRSVIAANTEMVRCMSEKFASVMEAAATLLRAADGAGMPQREVAPSTAPTPTAESEPTIIEVETDEAEGELAAILRSAMDTVMPLVGHTINTKMLGLTSDQSFALLGAKTSPAVPELPAAPTPPTKADVAEADTETRGPAPSNPPRDFGSHLRAIEALLDSNEIAMVRTAVAKMQPTTLLSWRERLMSLDPDGAAAVIRQEIGKGSQS